MLPVMGLQRILAGVCAVAGVAVLAGAGWALIAAAVLLFVLPTPTRLAAVAARGRVAVLAGWRWLLVGRRQVAQAAMPTGLGLAVAAAAITFGVAGALAAAAAGMVGLSLVLGWNA